MYLALLLGLVLRSCLRPKVLIVVYLQLREGYLWFPPGTLTYGSAPCVGAGLTAAAALPADPGLQNFWHQLAAVEHLSAGDSAELLQLGNNACFPLEGNAVQGRLLVRRCYDELSQILQTYIAAGGHTFIITGNPGDSFIMVFREISYMLMCAVITVHSKMIHREASAGDLQELTLRICMLTKLSSTLIDEKPCDCVI